MTEKRGWRIYIQYRQLLQSPILSMFIKHVFGNKQWGKSFVLVSPMILSLVSESYSLIDLCNIVASASVSRQAFCKRTSLHAREHKRAESIVVHSIHLHGYDVPLQSSGGGNARLKQQMYSAIFQTLTHSSVRCYLRCFEIRQTLAWGWKCHRQTATAALTFERL